MANRYLNELELFLAQQGIPVEIECLVECDESIPRSLTIVSDHVDHDRDVALMRALEHGATARRTGMPAAAIVAGPD